MFAATTMEDLRDIFPYPSMHSIAAFVIICTIMTTSGSTSSPAGGAGGAHEFGEFERREQGLDSFQKGMVIGFVTFAAVALLMMVLILYYLVRGTKRDIRKAQVELHEFREEFRAGTLASHKMMGRGAHEICFCPEHGDNADVCRCFKETYPPSYDNLTYTADCDDIRRQTQALLSKKKTRFEDELC